MQDDVHEIKSICILGAHLNTKNLGVSALAASLVKIITCVVEKSEITFISVMKNDTPQEITLSDCNVTAKAINCRLTPKAGLKKNIIYIFLLACIQYYFPNTSIKKRIVSSNPCLAALKNASCIGQIWGGDSFSDIYGLKRLLIGSMMSLTSQMLNKNFILLPQTYGPYKSRFSKMIARVVVKQSKFVMSRDLMSIKEVESLFKTKQHKPKVNFCPDVAFLLDSITPANIHIIPPIKMDKETPLIGFNVNGLLYQGGYTRNNMFGLKFPYRDFVYQMTKSIIKYTSANIILIPHTWGSGTGLIESDPDACTDLIHRLGEEGKNRINLVDMGLQEYNQSEVKGIIKNCDFFIGSRMHACIASLSQGIPTVGVAYSKKFQGVFESVNVGDLVIDARSADMEDTIKKILLLFGNRIEIKMAIKSEVLQIQNLIMRNFKNIFIEQ